MPSSFSASARYTLQATGENNNTWGVILNQGVFQLVDDNVNGRLGLALSGAKALSTVLGATDEARMAFLDVTGGAGGAITIPPVPKGYFLRNGAAGDVSLTTGSPGPFTFGPGDAGPVFSDGGAVYGLMLGGKSLKKFITDADQALIDYINLAISTGSLELPPATAADVGKALMVRNVGSPAVPVWQPSAITPADVPGVAVPTLPQAWTAKQVFYGNANVLAALIMNASEWTVVPSNVAISGLLNFDVVAGSLVYVFWGLSGNLTLNFRHSPTATLVSALPPSEVITLELMIEQGASIFAPTVFQIDGVAITPRWAGGTVPVPVANTSSFYSFVIRNNGGSFFLWASMTRFG